MWRGRQHTEKLAFVISPDEVSINPIISVTSFELDDYSGQMVTLNTDNTNDRIFN